MKKAVFLFLLAAAFTVFAACGKAEQPQTDTEPRLLVISADMVTDENISIIDDTFVTPCRTLVDEQDLLPALPEGEPSGVPQSKNWEPVKQSPYFPVSCYIDLGGYYYVTDLVLFDRNGSPTLTVQTGIPFQWERQGEYKLEKYNTWRRFELPHAKSTRFIRLVCNVGDTGTNEIGFYGYEDTAKHD